MRNIGVRFNIERRKKLAIRTLAAVCPAMPKIASESRRCQQFTLGVVSERNFCGKFVEI